MRLVVQPACRSRKEYIEHCKLMIKDTKVRFGNKLIWQYKTNSKGQRIGVVCAYKQDDFIMVGASKCNRTQRDKFDREIGLWQAINAAVCVPDAYAETAEELAEGLSYEKTFFNSSFPLSMHKLVLKMIFRARRQFAPQPAPTPEPAQA